MTDPVTVALDAMQKRIDKHEEVDDKQHERLDKVVDDHEKRLRKLEKASGPDPDHEQRLRALEDLRSRALALGGVALLVVGPLVSALVAWLVS